MAKDVFLHDTSNNALALYTSQYAGPLLPRPVQTKLRCIKGLSALKAMSVKGIEQRNLLCRYNTGRY